MRTRPSAPCPGWRGPGWTGVEGRSPDRLPVLGPIDGVSGLHVLGCAAGGFTLAPACGRVAAELLLGQEPAIPHRPYLVSRFLEGEDGLRPSATTEEIRKGP